MPAGDAPSPNPTCQLRRGELGVDVAVAGLGAGTVACDQEQSELTIRTHQLVNQLS